MTRRDYDIIEFLRYYKIASTATLQEMFFPSLRSCQNRLKWLTERGCIRRTRETINNQYAYYLRFPAQTRRALLVTDFYREMKKVCVVATFKIEPTLGNIRPDAVIGYSINGKGKLALLEVEISNKGFNHAKYASFDYATFFPVKPKIIVISDRVKPTEGLTVIPSSLEGVRASVR